MASVMYASRSGPKEGRAGQHALCSQEMVVVLAVHTFCIHVADMQRGDLWPLPKVVCVQLFEQVARCVQAQGAVGVVVQSAVVHARAPHAAQCVQLVQGGEQGGRVFGVWGTGAVHAMSRGKEGAQVHMLQGMRLCAVVGAGV